ncbi:sigma-54-dependent Fis family transcriptional regulator [Corticibacter populi]|uniref:Sigma-54-dependent Fis family transcriptional regulator n=1 Tax=Corticibacter populi TaxID=1550736 RepID=A0A3M6R0C6_9BURK|nr:sigma-54 dependent transcriptional regulator [Corticibacter populi]RMX08698.1 sigma-54-dependent Fis family transcriptional regulator [Corticibacter populi]RZS36046.1 DNA-binding NtrC family response regulator [Corticibacter populi]
MATSLPTWPLPAPASAPATTPEASAPTDAAVLPEWIFEDPASQALLKTLQQIAPSDAGVLIQGESGADKEQVARHLHALSPRRNGPFVTVNCGALSEGLINAELFGHESGAFTGAFGNLPGRFEDAHLGTLLLDEIDDLPLHMQSKLLRVLQDKSVTRLGASRRTPVDVRVLASSSRPLEQSVAARRFREDLYYLLGVVTLDVLPLRQRPGDILPLARHFIATYCQRLHYAPLELSAAAEQKLLAHNWPGNSRELENVIHRTLLLTQGLRIGADDLSIPATDEAPVTPSSADESQGQQAAVSHLALDDALESLCDLHAEGLEQLVQNALLRKVWQRNRFNQVHTARQLGISRSVVRARLNRLGLLGNGSPGAQDNVHDSASVGDVADADSGASLSLPSQDDQP